MKTTIKRTLATVLAVMMIFSLIPFTGAIFGSMSTKVSALETVEGSYDYLSNYLEINGEKSDEFGMFIKYNDYDKGNVCSSVMISKDPGDDSKILFHFFDLGKKETGSYLILIVEKYSYEYKIYCCYDHTNAEKNAYFDNATAIVKPNQYFSGDHLSYYNRDYLYNANGYINLVEKLFDTEFKLAVIYYDALLSSKVGLNLGNFGFINISESTPIPANIDEPVDPDEPTVEPDEPTVDPDEPTVDPDEPIVDPDEPIVDPDEPSVEPDKPSVDPDKPSVEPEKPEDSKTPSNPSKPADSVTPGDSKATTSDSQKKSGVKADSSVISSYKSSANRDGGTSPDTSESMDGIIAAVVTAFVGVTGLIIVKKKEKNED